MLLVFHLYAPNFEKVGSILLSACPFVCSFVRLSVRSKKFKARVLKFYIWIPRKKIAIIFEDFFISPCRVMLLLRAKSAIL